MGRTQANEYPKPSGQTGHGWADITVPGTSPFTEAPEIKEDYDGYGGNEIVKGELSYRGDGENYDDKVKK